MVKIKRKKINLAIQYHDLKKLEFVEASLDKGLIAKAIIKPTTNSSNYEIVIIYKSLEKSPHVLLTFPEIPITTKLPHVYPREMFNGILYPRLCLYLPNTWDNSMLLSNTIIPWAIEWVYYYEIWVITGNWLGGGKLYTSKENGPK